jgi:hypothetical protein
MVPPSNPQGLLLVPVSAGELVDKITILEIKQERIGDETKRANVARELALLAEVLKSLPASAALQELTKKLKEVNEQLWEIEDEIRRCERAADFGVQFIQLARSVYQINDRRSEIKRQINELLKSAIVEEKWYPGDRPTSPARPR